MSFFSAVVIARNEARTMAQCLDALKQVSDDIIVVLDSRSNDATEDIAHEKQARVVPFEWNGFSAGKNHGATLAKHDWILCLDADEIADDSLVQSLQSLTPDESSYYLMNIQTWFSRYPVRYCGWYPDWNIRLYHRNKMKWSQDFVHEKLVSAETLSAVKLAGKINHFSFSDEAHMREKYLRYAQLRAEEWHRSGRGPSLLKKWFGPAFRFFRTYVLKAGFLDGKTGYIIAHNEYIMKKNELSTYRQLIQNDSRH